MRQKLLVNHCQFMLKYTILDQCLLSFKFCFFECNVFSTSICNYFEYGMFQLQKSVKELKEQVKKYEETIQKQQSELLTVRRESLSLRLVSHVSEHATRSLPCDAYFSRNWLQQSIFIRIIDYSVFYKRDKDSHLSFALQRTSTV